MSVFFKVKSSKRSNPEARTTLDAIHSQQVQKLVDEKQNIDQFKEELAAIKKKITETSSSIDLWRLERDAEALEKKIKAVEDGTELMDYFLRTGDILYNYYDIQDQIQQGNYTHQSSKAKSGSILAILEEVAQEEGNKPDAPKPIQKAMQRNQLLNDYLQLEDPSMVRNTIDDYEDEWTVCDKCNSEMIICLNEAHITCSKCGYQEALLVDTDKPSYKDPPREACYYAYKKINHFNEWLAQFQAKESTEIPEDVFQAILEELKKERITNAESIKPGKVREILKKLKCTNFYEHVPYILNRINGKNAPVMSREVEEKLRFMFKEIQGSFVKHCPKTRSNFLSYSYVLYKFCELLELDNYLQCFPLLKNRDKLYNQDKIWQLICKDLSWEFIRSI